MSPTAGRVVSAAATAVFALAVLAPASSADTQLVKDINPGSASSYPAELTNFAGSLFFSADDGVHGYELWTSDGTAAGTTLVSDLNPGSGGSLPYDLTIADAQGRDVLYFAANDGSHGAELWAYGVSGLIKDIYPGSSGSSPDDLTTANDTLYFTADDGTDGTELWTSDGTAADTTAVSNLPANPSHLTDVGGTLYFSAYDPTDGFELWTSDGTGAGTRLVKDIQPGGGSSLPSNLTNVNGTLFFTANDGTHGAELWSSNGVAATTTLVRDIASGSDGSDPSDLVNVNGTLYLSATEGNGQGYGLWKSDGTAAGTVEVDDIYASVGLSSITNVNGTVFFVATDYQHGAELWKSDGTTAGTTLVKDIVPGSAGSDPSNLTNVNGTLYFTADDGTHGTELWTSDGTAAGTTLLSDINPGTGSSDPAFLTNVSGTLYFDADDGTHGGELWSFRPTLEVSRNGDGSGTVTSADSGIECGSDCSHDYAVADTVTLEAVPTSDSTFTGWSGACSGTSPTCTVPMTADRTVTATFAATPHTLTVALAGGGTGTVTSSPSGISCGSSCTQRFTGSVTLYATPASGSAFTGWSGAGCTGTASCTVAMDSDRAVTAVFTATSSEQPAPRVSLTGFRISARRVSLAGRRTKHRCAKPTKRNSHDKRCRLAIRLHIRYVLNVPAKVRITFQKHVPGRRVNGKCVAPTRRSAKHRRCTRLVNVKGALNQTGRAGRNSFAWNGRIGTRNPRPGTYTLVATADGDAATSRRATIKILG